MTILRIGPQVRDLVECMRVKPLLQSYLDGELDDESAAIVIRHLDACRRCGLAADAYRELCESLRAAAPDPDPAAVRRLTSFVEELTAEGEVTESLDADGR